LESQHVLDAFLGAGAGAGVGAGAEPAAQAHHHGGGYQHQIKSHSKLSDRLQGMTLAAVKDIEGKEFLKRTLAKAPGAATKMAASTTDGPVPARPGSERPSNAASLRRV